MPFLTRDVEVCEEFAGDSDVLQLGHQLAIKAAHCLASKEARLLLLQVVIDLAQDRQQISL